MESEHLLINTISCYDPVDGVSCGKCPTCSERMMNFIKAGVTDPIPYLNNAFSAAQSQAEIV